MKTITVDDRRSVVNIMVRILEKIDPNGEHIGVIDPEEVIKSAGGSYFDVAFMDVEMPTMNGIVLAKKLQDISPLTNIVFITGHQEYMPDAFGLYASGYLMKPITEEDVRSSLRHLRYHSGIDGAASKDVENGRKVRATCFGLFEVFAGDKPLKFRRSKSKELFAYLIDRRGALCSGDMIIGNLWPDKKLTNSLKSMERNVVSDMIKDFAEIGERDLIIHGKSGITLNMNRIDCDYYDYLDGDPYALHRYNGEYMSQYEWAESTRVSLETNRTKA